MKLNLAEFRSRKLWFALSAIVILFGGWCIQAYWISLAPQFATFKDGLIMIVTTYLGANVGHHVADAYANKGVVVNVDQDKDDLKDKLTHG